MKEITQSVFIGRPSWVVSATIDSDGDLFYHNIPSKFLFPNEDGLYEVEDVKGSDIWEYEQGGQNFCKVNWKNSKLDRVKDYGFCLIENMVNLNVYNIHSNYSLIGEKWYTASCLLVLSIKDEPLELELNMDLHLPMNEKEEHSLSFVSTPLKLRKKDKAVRDFSTENLTIALLKELNEDTLTITKYIRARVFDALV